MNYNIHLLKEAEKYMVENPYKAMEIIDKIPDSVLSNQSQLGWHHGQCITTARYYKAAKDIECNDIVGACYWLRLVIVNDKNNENIRETFELYDTLNILISNQFSNTQDIILKDRLITRLFSISESVNHRTEVIIPHVERYLTSNDFYWPCIFFLSSCLTLLLYIQHKQKKDAAIHDYKTEIEYLNKQAKRQKDNVTERLGMGRMMYESVRNGGQMKGISIEQEQCFIDYYAYAYPEEYSMITKPYTKLSLRHTTYLILEAMNYSDAEIQNILFIKRGTIRNYRLRMNKNKK